MKPDKHDREAAARERRRQRLADMVPAYDPLATPMMANEPLLDKALTAYLDELPDDAVPKFLRDSWRKLNG